MLSRGAFAGRDLRFQEACRESAIADPWEEMTMSVFAAEGNKPRHVRDQYHSEALGVTITLAEIFE